MTNNLTRIKERRKALEERLEAAKREKRNIEARVQEQLRKLREREINRWEYDDRLKRLFSDKSAEEWVDYYNQQSRHSDKGNSLSPFSPD